jgi:hypothetical protein
MDNKKQLQLTLKEKSGTVKCGAPLIFAIPRPFEDDYERNNGWFSKILKLEKKSKQLKEKIRELASKNNVQYIRTKHLVAQVLEMNKRIIERHWSIKQRSVD